MMLPNQFGVLGSALGGFIGRFLATLCALARSTFLVNKGVLRMLFESEWTSLHRSLALIASNE